MTQFTLTISTDNAAFDDGNLGPEVARILRDAAARVEYGDVREPGDERGLRDANGNTVGSMRLEVSP